MTKYKSIVKINERYFSNIKKMKTFYNTKPVYNYIDPKEESYLN
jgi:hypothetical protein